MCCRHYLEQHKFVYKFKEKEDGRSIDSEKEM